MCQLTGSRFLSDIVEKLNDEHKEILYFLSLRLYSTVRLAKLRGQFDRNIRKVRDTYTRKLQSQLYDHLCKRRKDHCPCVKGIKLLLMRRGRTKRGEARE